MLIPDRENLIFFLLPAEGIVVVKPVVLSFHGLFEYVAAATVSSCKT